MPRDNRHWILRELDAERIRLALTYAAVGRRCKPPLSTRRVTRILGGEATKAVPLPIAERLALALGLELELLPIDPTRPRRRKSRPAASPAQEVRQ